MPIKKLNSNYFYYVAQDIIITDEVQTRTLWYLQLRDMLFLDNLLTLAFYPLGWHRLYILFINEMFESTLEAWVQSIYHTNNEGRT
jgi:hypothetical protein